jgi:CheY-like chemotaxis protein
MAGLAALRPPAQTLLLVEDSRHAAEGLRLVARRLGLRLRRAETLAAARQHLRLYRPDAVLIDLGLPDGSGLELIAELAARPPASGAPRIVALSADPESREAALAAGALDFLAKPLRLPADLPVLLGPAAPAGGATGPLPPIDPLALRDDLARAGRALADQRLDYAAGFLQGLARCAGDPGLDQAATLARRTGEAGPLSRLLAERLAADPADLL